MGLQIEFCVKISISIYGRMIQMKNIENYVKGFEQYLIEEEKATATIEKYIRDVKSFANWLSDDQLTKMTVLKYKEYLTDIYATASVNSILSSLNSFFDYAEWNHLKVKTIKIQKRIFSVKSKELTVEEYNKLLGAAKKNKKLYYLMQTICSSGIRVSELKFITVEAVREKQAIIKCKGKMRIVFLPDKLCKMLLQYAKERKITSGPVFVSKKGKPLDRSSIWKMMKNLCEDAGVERDKVFPHNLRHLFARTYYSIQKDIVRLADILGHSSINTTRIYTMETGEVHRKQIQNLGLLRI